MMTVGVFLCGWLILLKTKRTGVGCNEMIIVMAMSLGTGLFCAGALYILVTYSIKEVVLSVLKGDFSIFENGGLVFYGGLIGGIAGAILALKWQKLDINRVEQCMVPALPLGHAIGRIGCLLAGCCHGFEYNGPFAVKNLLLSAEKTYFPIQAVEAFLNLAIFVFLLWYGRKKRRTYHMLCLYLCMYSVVRFIIEFFRGDDIRGGFLTFSTSQWISLMIFLISSLCFVFSSRKVKAKAIM